MKIQKRNTKRKKTRVDKRDVIKISAQRSEGPSLGWDANYSLTLKGQLVCGLVNEEKGNL